jgi:hypothetical protein
MFSNSEPVLKVLKYAEPAYGLYTLQYLKRDPVCKSRWYFAIIFIQKIRLTLVPALQGQLHEVDPLMF